ncbi:MAG: T9SS type A sorting domain-containing protein [Bacteroidota bacterium]
MNNLYKKLFIFICLVITGTGLFAQSNSNGANGDYRITATTNTGQLTAWQLRSGTWGAAVGTMATNLTAASNIFIQTGYTLTVSASCTVNNVNISTTGVLIVPTGQVLYVNGIIRTFTGTALATGADGVYTNANPTVATMIQTTGTGKIVFIGASRTMPVLGATTTYSAVPTGWNMEIDMPSATATLGVSGHSFGSLTVTNGTFSYGSTLRTVALTNGTPGASVLPALTVAATGTLDMSGAGIAHTLTFSGIGSQAIMSGAFNTTASSGSSVTYSAAGNQTLFAGAYQNLIVNNATGTKTFGASPVTVNGTCTITAGVLDIGSNTFSGTNLSIAAAGTMSIGGTNTFPSFSGTVTLTGTVNYSGTDQDVPARSYANLFISGSGTKTLNATPTTVAGICSVQAGTFSFGTSARALNITGNMVVSPGAVLDMSGSGLAHTLTFTGVSTATMLGTFNTTAASGSTVSYTANGLQTMFASPNYQKLSISGTGTATKTTGGSITVNDLMTFGATTTAPVTIAAGHTFTLAGTTGANVYFTGGTATSHLDMTAITAATILNHAGTPAYGNLSLSTGMVTLGTLGGIMTVNGAFTQASGGTLHFGTVAHTVSVAATGSFSAYNITMSGIAGNALNLAVPNSATLACAGTLTTVAGNVITYNGANQNIFPSLNYGALTISGSAGTKTMTGNVTLSGAFTASTAGSIFDIGSNALTANAGFTTGANCFPGNAASNLILSGNTAVTLPVGFANINNLSLTRTGNTVITLGNNLNVAGNLILSGTTPTLALSTFTVTGTNTGTFTLPAGSFLSIGNAVTGTNTMPDAFGTYSINATSTVTYQGGNNQPVASGGALFNYGHLIVGVPTNATKVLTGGVLNVAGNLTVTAGCTLSLGTAASAGALSVTGATAINGTSNLVTTVGVLDLGTSATTATLTGTIAVAAGGKIIFNNGSAKTLNLVGALTTVAGGIIDMSADDLGHVLKLNTLTNTFALNPGLGSTVNYSGGIVQTVLALTNYRNLTFSGTGNKNVSAGTTTVTGSADFSTAAAPCSVLAGATLSMNGSMSSAIYFASPTATSHLAIGSLNSSSGTLNITGTSAFGTLTMNGTGVLTLGTLNTNSLSTSTLTIGTGGTLNLGTTSTAVTFSSAAVTGTLAFGSSGTRTVTVTGNLSGAGTIDMAGTISQNHTLNLTGGTNAMGSILTTAGSGSTIIYNANAAQTIVPGNFYQNLTLSGASSSAKVKNFTGDVTVAGTLSILTFNNLTIGANTLQLGGTLPALGASAVITGGTTSNLILDGAGGYALPAITGGLNNFTHTANATGITTLGANLVLAGNLDMQAGTISFGATASRSLTVGGNFNAVNINMSAAATQALNLNGASNALTGLLSNTATSVVTYGGGIAQTIFPAVYTNLSLSAGTLRKSLTGNAEVTGTLTVSATDTLDINTNTFTLSGSTSGTAGTVKGASPSVLVFGGSSGTASAFAYKIAPGFGTLRIDKTGANNYITLGQNITVGSLDLANGILTTSGYEIGLAPDAVLPAGSATSYVNGRIKYRLSGSTLLSPVNLTFPLGISSSSAVSPSSANKFRPFTVSGLKQSAGTAYLVQSTAGPGSAFSDVYANPPVGVSSDNYYVFSPDTLAKVSAIAGVGLPFYADLNGGTVQSPANSVVAQLSGGSWANRGGTGSSVLTSTNPLTFYDNDFVFAIGVKVSVNVYVRNDGDDANSGTSNTAEGAKRTITAGVEAVAPGGNIYVEPGTYTETPILNKDFNLVGPASGNAVVDGFILGNASQVVVSSAAAADVATNRITAPVAHNFQTGERIIYESQAGSISGLTDDQAYYVIRIDATKFQLASSYLNALTGSPVSLGTVTAGALGSPAIGQVFSQVFVRAQAVSNNITGSSITVPAGGSIVTALQLASSGATITLAAGQYYQSFSISKSITLGGAGKYASIINGNYGVSSASGKIGITLYANNITLQNMKLQGFKYGMVLQSAFTGDHLLLKNMAVSLNGLYGFQTAGIDPNLPASLGASNIIGCNFDSNGVTGSSGCGIICDMAAITGASGLGGITGFNVLNSKFSYNNSAGIDLHTGFTFSDVLMKGNTFENNGMVGLSAWFTVSSGNFIVDSNTVSMGVNSFSRDAANAQTYGIEFKNPNGDGSTSGANCFVISRNTVRQTASSTANSADYAGIAIVRHNWVYNSQAQVNPDFPKGVVIINNDISNIKRSAAPCAGTAVTGDGIGLFVTGTGMKVRYNSITNCNIGMQGQAGNKPISTNSSNVNPNNSNPPGCPFPGIGTSPSADYFERDNSATYGSASAGAAYNYINFNSFEGNTIGFRCVSNITSQLMDVSGNWWGNASGPLHSVYNTTGTGQSVTQTYVSASGAKIAFSPWLKADPDDNETTIGIQINGAKIYVAGGTQNTQPSVAVGNVSLVQNFFSSVYRDELEVNGSNYPTSESANLVTAIVFNMKSVNNGAIGSLTVNNAATKIYTTGQLNIATTLTLTSGIIYTTSANPLVLNAGATATTTGTGFVDGPMALIRNSTSAATGNYPVGLTGFGRRLVSFNFTQGTATPTTYTLTLHDEPAGSLGNSLPGSLDKISPARYYNLAQSPATPFTGNSIKLSYDNDELVSDETQLRIAADFGTSSWNDIGGTGTAVLAGSITSSVSFSALGNFALANATGGSNLPPFIYVDPVTGNDNNQGTFALPLKSITVGLSTVQPGSRLYLAGGNYADESVTITAPVALNLTQGSTIPASNFNVTFANNITLYYPYPDSGQIQANLVQMSNSQNVIANGVLITKAGGVVKLPASTTYNEDLLINKPLTLRGNNYLKTGTDGTRANHTVLRRKNAGSSDGNVITVTADNVTIEGLTIEGTGTAAARAIANGTDAAGWLRTTNSLTVQNNIIQSVSVQGITLNGPGTTAATGNVITGNWIKTISANGADYGLLSTNPDYTGRGILLRNNHYANVTANTIEGIYNSIYTRDFNLPGTGTISNNTLKAAGLAGSSGKLAGCYLSRQNATGSDNGDFKNNAICILNINHGLNSNFTVSSNSAENTAGLTNCGFTGYMALNVTDNAILNYNNNNVYKAGWKYDAGTGFCSSNYYSFYGHGYYLFNCSSSNTVTIDGGYIGGSTANGTAANACGVGIRINNALFTGSTSAITAGSSNYSLKNVTIEGADFSVWVSDYVPANLTVNMTGMNLINGAVNTMQTNGAGIMFDNYTDPVRNMYVVMDKCTLNAIPNRGMQLMDVLSIDITNCTFTGNCKASISSNGTPPTAADSGAAVIHLRARGGSAAYPGIMNNINITNNYFAGNGKNVIYFDSAVSTSATYYGTFDAPITIQNNSFARVIGQPRGNLNLGGWKYKNKTCIEASGNWWGYTDPANVKTMAGGHNFKADYNGWLNTATDNSVSPGFQPNFDTLNVTNLANAGGSLSSGDVGRFNDALSMLNNGGKIKMQGATAFTGANAADINKDVIITAVSGAQLDMTMDAPGKKVTLGSNLTLTALTLNNGFVVPGAYTLSLPASGLSGGSLNSYVKGKLSLSFPSSTAAAATFPVGTDNTYRPFSFSTTFSTAAANTFTASLTDAGLIRTISPLINIDTASPFRYYTLTRSAGGNTMTSGYVTLNYGTTGSSNDQVTDPPSLRVVSDNGTAAWANLGGAGSSANAGNISSYISFNPMALNNTFNFAIANLKNGTNFGAIFNGLYVDYSLGKDTNSGSAGAPLKTITKAVSMTLPGGTINVVGGQNYPATTINGRVKLVKASGTDAHIAKAIFSGGGEMDTTSTGIVLDAVEMWPGCKLSRALKLAADGALVSIIPGVYNETVNIFRPLTFTTPGGGVTISRLAFNAPGQELKFDSDFIISGRLTLTAGTLNMRNSTLSIKGNLQQSASGFLKSEGGASLVLGGSGDAESPLSFATGYETVDSLVINRSGVVRMGSPITSTGRIILRNGKFDLNGQVLTLSGTSEATDGYLRLTSGSNLNIIGTGPFGSIGFDPTGSIYNTLGSFSFSRGATGSVTLTSDLTVSNTLTVTDGWFGIGSNTLTLGGSFAGAGKLRGSSISNLSITGSGAFSNLIFDETPGANTLQNFTVARGAGNDVTLLSDVVVQNQMNLTSGNLVLNGNALTLNGTAGTGTGQITGSAVSDITIGGSGAFGSFRLNQGTPGTTNVLRNLSIAKGSTGSVTLGGALTVNGNLDLSSGAFVLSSNTLNLTGTATTSGGYLRGSSTSVLSITGSGDLGVLAFDPTSTATSSLNSLNLNRSGGTVTLGSNLSISGSAALTSGTVILNGNAFSMGGTIAGTGKIRGSSTSDLSLSGTGSYTLYPDATTPGSSNMFRTLNLSRNGTVTMGYDLVTGSSGLSLSASVLDLNGQKLTVSGPAAYGSGYIKGSATSDVTFASGSSGATLKMSGSTADKTIRNLVINPGGTNPIGLSSDVYAGTSLTLTSGILGIGSNVLNINGILSGSGTVKGSGSSQVVFGASAASATFTPDQSTPGTTNLFSNFSTGNAAAVVSLGGNANISGTLALTGNIALNDKTLGLSGSISGTGQLTGSANAALNISGTGALTLPLDNSTEGTSNFIKTMAVTRTGGYVGISNNLYSGGISLATGSILDLSGKKLTMTAPITYAGTGSLRGSSASDLVLNAGSAGMVLTFGGTSSEMTLHDFTVNYGTGSNIALGSDLHISGTQALTAGNLNLGSFTLYLDGSANTGSGYLRGSAASNLLFTGGSAYMLNLDAASTPGTSNRINNLSITNSAATVLLGSNARFTGVVTNDGLLALNGNTLELNATSISGTGTLAGSSSSVLSIGGTGPLGSFSFDQSSAANHTLAALSMNRTASGTATIVGDLTVNGNISTTNGLLVDTTGIIDISATSVVTESNANSSRVIGSVRTTRDMASTSTVYNTGMGLTLNAGTTAMGNGTTVTRVTMPAGKTLSANNRSPYGRSIARYYDIEPGNTGAKDAIVTFTYMDAELNGFTAGGLTKVYRAALPYNTPNPGWVAYSGTTAGNVFTNAETIPDFSRITLGGDDFPLPVTFLSFDAVRKQNSVSLKWTTTSEQDAAWFMVERSFDGVTFEQVGKVAAGGNNTGLKAYSFTDNFTDSPAGTVYYRLRQTDINGTYMFSGLRHVNFDKESANIKPGIYPNPARGELFISNAEDGVSLEIYDLTGRQVLNAELPANAASNRVDVSELLPGLYNVLIIRNNERVYRKLRIL